MIGTRSKRIGGYGHWTNGAMGSPDIERDTVTCIHCNTVVFIDPLKPVEDFTGWCMRCMKFICLECAAKGDCRPFEKWLDKVERGVAR